MIDPRTTNLIGERVRLVRKDLEGPKVLGRGIVRVVDYVDSHRGFNLLIEALEPIEFTGFDVWVNARAGALFQLPILNETVEVVVEPTEDLDVAQVEQQLAAVTEVFVQCGAVIEELRARLDRLSTNLRTPLA